MERDKALQMALGQIEKQFGKGAVMRMGDQSRIKVAVIPTGALALDLALGVGGLPRGRVVEIYGPESSGKCVPADTRVWTDRGLETVAELFARCGQETSGTSRITDISESGVRVVNERGELEQVAALTHNNRKPVLRLRLQSGRTLSATHNHPLRVMSEPGAIVWRAAGQIAPGDTLVSAAFGAVQAADGDGLSEDEAVLLGYLVAEGSLRDRSAVRFITSDPEAGGEFTRLTEQLFDATVRCDDGKQYAVEDTVLRAELADRYGLDYVADQEKTVPHRIRIGGHKAQRAFLSALFEGNGWIDEPSMIRLKTPSAELARDVQLMLYGFGIPATIFQRDSWTVAIDPAVAHLFRNEIGFRSAARRAQAAANVRRPSREPRFDDIPHLAGLPALGGNRYTFERVQAVEDAGEQPTFDLVLPRTHSFLANGVLSHNTTVALHAIAEAQKAGGIAAFVDAEHALDPSYAAALGVDMEALLVSQPDTGEQALEITDMLVRSGAVDIVVIDSVAALTPRAELEGEMGDTHVGLQARLMSQALRKLAGTLNRSRTCCVFINQLREKVGVMFGCLSWHSRVMLSDGTSEYIGKIVDQRMPVEVLSYDPASDRVVPKKVVNWFDNGPTADFLHFRVARDGRGPSEFACTLNHQVRTPCGWREAREFAVGDRVMRLAPHYLSEWQWQVVLGGVMGAGTLPPGERYGFGHDVKQTAYADWKASLLASVKLYRSTDDEHAVFYESQPLPELAELQRAVYIGDKKVLSYDYLKRLTPLSIAIWYMDGASFTSCSESVQEHTRGGAGLIEICVEALERTSRVRLSEHLQDTWGIGSTLIERADEAVLQFSTTQTDDLQALIARYVHPSMEYKLLPRHHGKFAVEPEFRPVRHQLVPATILAIEPHSPSQANSNRYDIEVEGSHNYFADGVMVHNSPEVTPGGRALKFYSSVRLDVRRIESLKDGTDFVGNRVRVKVVKNKVAPPFQQCEFDILFGQGISREGSLLDVGVEHGIIKKAGAWYTYESDQLGQGRENARRFLREHDDIAAEIYKRVTEKLGLVPTDVTGDEQI